MYFPLFRSHLPFQLKFSVVTGILDRLTYNMFVRNSPQYEQRKRERGEQQSFIFNYGSGCDCDLKCGKFAVNIMLGFTPKSPNPDVF